MSTVVLTENHTGNCMNIIFVRINEIHVHELTHAHTFKHTQDTVFYPFKVIYYSWMKIISKSEYMRFLHDQFYITPSHFFANILKIQIFFIIIRIQETCLCRNNFLFSLIEVACGRPPAAEIRGPSIFAKSM